MKKQQKILSEVKKQVECTVLKISGNLQLKRRLLELGFVKGTSVKIINISPLKNSYLIEVRNYVIAMRKSAVEQICVEID